MQAGLSEGASKETVAKIETGGRNRGRPESRSDREKTKDVTTAFGADRIEASRLVGDRAEDPQAAGRRALPRFHVVLGGQKGDAALRRGRFCRDGPAYGFDYPR